MEAQTVFRVWRRILRSPDLQRKMFDVDANLMSEFKLSPNELEVVHAYASNENAVRISVTNYRYRLVSSFENALETAASLTYRALRNSGADLRSMAVPFLDSIKWHDYGPYVYTYCARILDWLAEQKETEKPNGLRDLIEIERVAGSLVRIAAAQTPNISPANPMNFDDKSIIWEASSNAEIVSTRHDLSGWLRSPELLGRENSPLADCTYLISLKDPSRNPQISSLMPLSAALMAEIKRDTSSLRSLLARLAHRGINVTVPDAAYVLGELVSRGVVQRSV
ncbi:MAG: hypothetical protein RNU03_12975 [Candidatus Sedimenticola sp. (ex Thyasira tokunagai)]